MQENKLETITNLFEESEVVTNCDQLKMLAPDVKMGIRDALDTKGILRLIESVPNPKAEVFCTK